MASWADLDRPNKPEPTPDDLSQVCARVFSSPDGKELLKLLRAMTIEKVLPENSGDAALRELEGQRKIIRRLETATERGLHALANQKKS